ncbi:MAG: magnesium chelatase ATPase subunit D [Acidobacteriota bacterium]
MKHHSKNIQRARFPFAAIVGLEAAKRALLLLAIDPELRGVLISGSSGSAKSLLARSFQSLTDDLDRAASRPFVELPLNVTEEQLLGGLDLEATLASGKRCVSRGALARADGGALYVDEVNLLDTGAADHMAAALEDGCVRLEREGISKAFPSHFVFIGTSDPSEGEVSSNLRDRVGLLIEMDTEESASDGAHIIERALEFDKGPDAFVAAWLIETAAIKSQIKESRERLCRIAIGREDITRIAQVAMSLGVEGNRADIFAMRAARASAALAGRDSIEDEDLVLAIKLVLLPRATEFPPSAEPQSRTQDSQQADSLEDAERGEREPNETSASGENPGVPAEDLLIEAIGSPAPDEALTLEAGAKRTGRKLVGSGKRAQTDESSRGRYTGVLRVRRGAARIAVDATLRAAAPYQVARQAKHQSKLSAVATTQTDGVPMRERRINIQPGDLRFKRFKQRSGALFIFAVDASGSMAVNRMAQAKGAITRLLGEAYLHRDKVALISFRGSKADVLLAPTRSVELAKRLVDAMPSGGGTPVSAGLLKALDLARLARLQKVSKTLVVLFTDGRANVRLRNGARSSKLHEELSDIGRLLKSEGIKSLVVDTRSKFVSGGEGSGLAQTLGARYLYLPNPDGQRVYDVLGMMAGRDCGSDGDESAML